MKLSCLLADCSRCVYLLQGVDVRIFPQNRHRNFLLARGYCPKPLLRILAQVLLIYLHQKAQRRVFSLRKDRYIDQIELVFGGWV